MSLLCFFVPQLHAIPNASLAAANEECWTTMLVLRVDWGRLLLLTQQAWPAVGAVVVVVRRRGRGG